MDLNLLRSERNLQQKTREFAQIIEQHVEKEKLLEQQISELQKV